ncbi:carboxymuconolactone decarboxylase family protein [Aldersonia sp. NBC_00410]|uniref:carboxymuconolactone decarboxylase family protein n=1 Tax=Aldersonia sp. NBC_00410 TaxID=2975954 RepID=UPI00224DBA9E|nr:carboxymuconolactone decarboxylase family protein [Aldersonia sp. NBC_00410]MCX5044288.1 carboxymuconolactone decarboxylase family protein [Aldersonia sp. NBC_00410]
MMNQNGVGQDRLHPLAAEQWGEEEYAAFGALLGMPGEKVPRAGSGHTHDPMKFDVIGLLVRHPDLARAFLAFNGFLIQRGELPSRLRELAIMRVIHRHRSAYEWGQHVRMASENGVFAEDIDKLAQGNAGFKGSDRVVLEFTDELLANGHAQWDAWQRLVETVGERQAMELIFVVGSYVLAAMAFETWRLPASPGAAQLP